MTLPAPGPDGKDRTATISGVWKDGKLEGRASCTREDGTVLYHLNFAAGQIEGNGMMLLKSTGNVV